MAMTNKVLAVQNAIIAAVNAITSASAAYNHDLNGGLKFGHPNADEVIGGLPEVYLTTLNEEAPIRPTNTMRKRLTYTLVGVTGAQVKFDDVGTDTLKLAADIEKSILTDVTLGSVVDYTRMESMRVEYFGEPTKGFVTLEFYSEYAVTVGTP